MGLQRFTGRKIVIALLYTGMGFPPVVVGLFVYMLLISWWLFRNALNWSFIPHLFTPGAMIIAQTIISFPLWLVLQWQLSWGLIPIYDNKLFSLGATSRQAVWTVLMEAKVGVMVSIIAGFGGIISEVGAVMLVGGNIEGKTRVLTTAIVLETRKGNFDLALALGGVLLLLSFIANVAMLRLQGKAFDE